MYICIYIDRYTYIYTYIYIDGVRAFLSRFTPLFYSRYDARTLQSVHYNLHAPIDSQSLRSTLTAEVASSPRPATGSSNED